MSDKIDTWPKAKLALVSIAFAISVRQQAGLIFHARSFAYDDLGQSAHFSDFFAKPFCVDSKASFLTCTSFFS